MERSWIGAIKNELEGNAKRIERVFASPSIKVDVKKRSELFHGGPLFVRRGRGNSRGRSKPAGFVAGCSFSFVDGHRAELRSEFHFGIAVLVIWTAGVFVFLGNLFVLDRGPMFCGSAFGSDAGRYKTMAGIHDGVL